MSSLIKFNPKKAEGFIANDKIASMKQTIEECNTLLHSATGRGNDFLGWVDLPSSITTSELDEIENAANVLRSKAELVIVIGIGGSYLGAKAVIDSLSNNFDWLQKERKNPIVVFAGQNMSEGYIAELMQLTKSYEIATVVISKSGTTTEPAIAFRIIKEEIENRYGKEEASSRIVAVTDKERGALRSLSNSVGYKTFIIPDNVGGRFSVLTPVGLLPLAVAGINIKELVAGAVEMERQTAADVKFDDNIAAQYAAYRSALYELGKGTEILASYEPKLQNIAEWWKQLYGESEGKEGKGIFPASVTYSADLHSMGQYIQEGVRNLFETVIHVEKSGSSFDIKADKDNLDGLNFLAGKSLTEVNHNAEAGVMLAHVDGGVPNLQLSIESINEKTIGALLYFFEKACGISGYALGVNPFDQPGVEAYKKNMFALLGKPGFEKEGEELRKRL
ncbi:MAG: glucose-6-phosphate isomerase [Rikenellaceae bacterium]